MARDLLVIEAPGKLRTVHAAVAALGWGADVVATMGHLYEGPEHLTLDSLVWRDGALEEVTRRPARPDSFAYVSERLERTQGRILVATDDDQEGHVIAQDVADLAERLNPGVVILRIKPHGLLPANFRDALAAGRPIDAEDARPGNARRLADRLISVACSDFAHGHVAGRVQSAILGLAELDDISMSTRMAFAHAEDGGTPFSGRVGLDDNDPRLSELAGLLGVPVASSQAEALRLPLHGGDALIEIHSQLGMDVADAASLLQAMYEAGEISYPRTERRGLYKAGADAVAALAAKRGIRAFHRDQLPIVSDEAGLGHEAIHVLSGKLLDSLDLGRPLRLHGDARAAVAALIGRASIEAGTVVYRERPALAALPGWARNIDWSREGRSPALPWRRPAGAAVRILSPAAALVQAQVESGIGRPSTWHRHASKVLDRGLLDDQCHLTIAGRLTANRTRSSLKDPATSVAIERVFCKPDLSVSDRAVEALRLVIGDDGPALQAVLDAIPTENFDEHPLFTP